VYAQNESLTCFDGSPADAFDALVDKLEARENKFMSFNQLLEKSITIYDESTLFQKGASLENTFVALFGAQSCFHQRFHDLKGDRDLRFQPPRPLAAEGAPWGATNTLTCKVALPVLGLCKWEEVSRFVLCREKNQVTLAVQQLGKLRLGIYGEFPIEVLYLFTQVDNDDTVRLQVFTEAPKRFVSQTIEAFRKSISIFCTAAREAMEDWEKNSTTEKQNENRCSDKDCHISDKTSEENNDAAEEMFTLLACQIF
jgi:hypothetical protein